MIRIIFLVLCFQTLIFAQMVKKNYFGEDDVLDDNLVMYHFIDLSNSISYNNINIANTEFPIYSNSINLSYNFNLLYGYETINMRGKPTYTAKKWILKSGPSLPYVKLMFKYSWFINTDEENIKQDLKFSNESYVDYLVYRVNLNQTLFSLNEYGLYLIAFGYSYNNIINNSRIISKIENMNKNSFEYEDYKPTSVVYKKNKNILLNNFSQLHLGLNMVYDIKFSDKNDNSEYKSSDFNAEYNYLKLNFAFEYNYLLNKPNEIFNVSSYSINVGLSYPLPLFGIYKDLK